MTRKWTQGEINRNLEHFAGIGKDYGAYAIAVCEKGIMIHGVENDLTHTMTVIGTKVEHQYHGGARHGAYAKLGKGLATYRKGVKGWYGETV